MGLCSRYPPYFQHYIVIEESSMYFELQTWKHKSADSSWIISFVSVPCGRGGRGWKSVMSWKSKWTSSFLTQTEFNSYIVTRKSTNNGLTQGPHTFSRNFCDPSATRFYFLNILSIDEKQVFYFPQAWVPNLYAAMSMGNMHTHSLWYVPSGLFKVFPSM